MLIIFISVHLCSLDEDEDGDDEEEHEPVGFDLGACPDCRGVWSQKGGWVWGSKVGLISVGLCFL